MNNRMLFITSSALLLSTLHSYNFAAGVRFKNNTPFKINVTLLSDRDVSNPFYPSYTLEKDPSSPLPIKKRKIEYWKDPAAIFTVDPGKDHFYDAIFSGFRGVEIYIESHNYLFEFEVHIPGITGIRDWVLTGKSPENMSLYIGPTGLDPEIGVVKKYRISQPNRTVIEKYERYFRY